jgi:hypothetical protein
VERKNIGNFATGSMRTDKVSATLKEKVCDRQSISNFERRSMRTDKVSATLKEKVCGQTKYQQL